MAGQGFAPKTVRRNKSDVPIRGEWQATPGIGWQHGPIPEPPPGLMPGTVAVWFTWMRSWYASNWTADYMPQLVATVRLYDAFERGDFKSVTELRQWMDGAGITWKGQQDRRWAPPKPEDVTGKPSAPVDGDPYAHLRVVPPSA
jgi:hypothetical protein